MFDGRRLIHFEYPCCEEEAKGSDIEMKGIKCEGSVLLAVHAPGDTHLFSPFRPVGQTKCNGGGSYSTLVYNLLTRCLSFAQESRSELIFKAGQRDGE